MKDKTWQVVVPFVLFIFIVQMCTSCTKEIITEKEIIKVVEVPVTTIITETNTVTIEVEATPTVIDTGYVFDLSEYNNISNVILFKEIAGSEAYRTFNYKELGELDALIEQGYLIIENNSCCLDEANAYLVISTWDGERHVFHYTIRK